MGIIESILVAVGLCADCFAVSLCSSVTIKSISWKKVACVALIFAVIQAGLLLIGYTFGSLFVGFLDRLAHIIGFLLLLYVGGSMLYGGIRGKSEQVNLDGLRNIVLGGIATSIDALAIGVAQSLTGGKEGIVSLVVAVFIITALSVVSGIYGGKAAGNRLGRWAEIAGGLVLIGIGVAMLF